MFSQDEVNELLARASVDTEARIEALRQQVKLAMTELKDELKAAKDTIAQFQSAPTWTSTAVSKPKNKDRAIHRKTLEAMPKYSGKSEDFDNWRFKVRTYLVGERGMNEVMLGLEKMIKKPDLEDLKELIEKVKAQLGHDDFDEDEFSEEWTNRNLYNLLSITCTDKALTMVKNLVDQPETNGMIGYWKLVNEVTSMTAQRMAQLTGAVLNPKPAKDYATVVQVLEEWEYQCKEWERLQEAKLPEPGKMHAMTMLCPKVLQENIGILPDLNSAEKIKKYIYEQATLKKGIRSTTSSGPTPMDVDTLMKKKVDKQLAMVFGDASENDDSEQQNSENENAEDMTEEQKVDAYVFSMIQKHYNNKGKGKGQKGAGGKGFQGNCSHCGEFGHKLIQCPKKDKEMDAWRRGQQFPTGGYQSQGQHGGGWNNGKGGGKGFNKHGNQWQGGKGWGHGGGSKGKGKSYSGLNLWDYCGQGDACQHDQWQGEPAGKSPWTLNQFTTRAYVPPPPGLHNMWSSLTREEANNIIEEEFSDNYSVNEEEFPDDFVTVKKKHKKMPKMNNGVRVPQSEKKNSRTVGYQPNGHLNIFVPAQSKSELNNYEQQRPGGHQRGGACCVKIEGVMDSGASESVAPPGLCADYPIMPSAGSKSGQMYTTAGKDEIPNMGEQILDVILDNGKECQVKYQVAEVNRPLNSISEICDAADGQVVIFGRSGGAVLNLATGEQTPFRRKDGIYVLDTWVKPRTTSSSSSGFPRQGR